MKHVVTVIHMGNTFGLRGTVWTDPSRATQYDTREAAVAALQKAKPFMHAKIFRAAKVAEVQSA